MMNKRTMALGTVNTVHVDWDTNVNPAQTACSGPLPWSLGMAPGVGGPQSCLQSIGNLFENS